MIDTSTYMNLAYKIAHKYDGRGIARDELFGAALIGLQEAANKWDKTRGVFATCVHLYVKAAITDLFKKQSTKFNLYQGYGADITEMEYADDVADPNLALDLVTIKKKIRLLKNNRQNVILRRYYGGAELVPRQTIAKEMGISYQRVAEIEETALRDLRKILGV